MNKTEKPPAAAATVAAATAAAVANNPKNPEIVPSVPATGVQTEMTSLFAAQFRQIPFDKQQYQELRQHFLEKRVRHNEELPTGMSLRKQCKQADLDMPEYGQLRKCIDKFDQQDKHDEIFWLLLALAAYRKRTKPSESLESALGLERLEQQQKRDISTATINRKNKATTPKKKKKKTEGRTPATSGSKGGFIEVVLIDVDDEDDEQNGGNDKIGHNETVLCLVDGDDDGNDDDGERKPAPNCVSPLAARLPPRTTRSPTSQVRPMSTTGQPVYSDRLKRKQQPVASQGQERLNDKGNNVKKDKTKTQRDNELLHNEWLVIGDEQDKEEVSELEHDSTSDSDDGGSEGASEGSEGSDDDSGAKQAVETVIDDDSMDDENKSLPIRVGIVCDGIQETTHPTQDCIVNMVKTVFSPSGYDKEVAREILSNARILLQCHNVKGILQQHTVDKNTNSKAKTKKNHLPKTNDTTTKPKKKASAAKGTKKQTKQRKEETESEVVLPYHHVKVYVMNGDCTERLPIDHWIQALVYAIQKIFCCQHVQGEDESISFFGLVLNARVAARAFKAATECLVRMKTIFEMELLERAVVPEEELEEYVRSFVWGVAEPIQTLANELVDEGPSPALNKNAVARLKSRERKAEKQYLDDNDMRLVLENIDQDANVNSRCFALGKQS